MPKIVINLFGEWIIDYSSVVFKKDEKKEISLHPKQTVFDLNFAPTLF